MLSIIDIAHLLHIAPDGRCAYSVQLQILRIKIFVAISVLLVINKLFPLFIILILAEFSFIKGAKKIPPTKPIVDYS